MNLLLTQYSIKELSESAEQYFSVNRQSSYLLNKPFASVDETPTLLSHFAAATHALDLYSGCSVLDFGSGSGWTSRMLAQMGCLVISADISPSALEIARDAQLRSGDLIAANSISYLLFDGFTLDLDDGSVDRVLVMDSFHHVVNQIEVIKQFERVLKPGGYLVFSEPGPSHSLTFQAQSEMKNYRAIERNFCTEEMIEISTAVGLEGGELGIYSPIPHLVPITIGEAVLSGDLIPLTQCFRDWHSKHRLLRFSKPGKPIFDSRKRFGLEAEMEISETDNKIYIKITNTGIRRWLPSGSTLGAVNLGCHLLDMDHTVLQFGFERFHLSDKIIEPSSMVSVEITKADLPDGLFEFDLVSEHVSWLSWDGQVFPRVKVG